MTKAHSYPRMFHWLLSLMLAISLLAAAAPRPAQAAVNAVCEDTHIVKAGEGIYRISRTHEVSVYRIARANNLEYPYRLQIGQSLCIPGENEPSSSFSWSATFSGDKVTITGKNFKKQHTFFSKVRATETSPWYKLDRVVTERDGDLDESVKVPSALRKQANIFVCLKDGVTDYLSCKLVWRK